MKSKKSQKKGQGKKGNEGVDSRVFDADAWKLETVSDEEMERALEREEKRKRNNVQFLEDGCEQAYKKGGVRGVQIYLADTKVSKACNDLGDGPGFFLKYDRRKGHFSPWLFGNLMDFHVDRYELEQEEERLKQKKEREEVESNVRDELEGEIERNEELQEILDKKGPEEVQRFLWKKEGKYYSGPDVVLAIFLHKAFVYEQRRSYLPEDRVKIDVSTSKKKKEQLQRVIKRLEAEGSTKKWNNISSFMVEAAWGTANLMDSFGVTMEEVFFAATLYLENREQMDNSRGKA